MFTCMGSSEMLWLSNDHNKDKVQIDSRFVLFSVLVFKEMK